MEENIANEIVQGDTLIVKTERTINRDGLLTQKKFIEKQLGKLHDTLNEINRKLDLWDSGKR
jgi:hypothetical protein